MTTFIYALKDPDTSEIRYVGKANDPIKRLGQHYAWAKRGNRRYLYCWMRACSGIPVLEILAEVPKSCWEFFEQAVIYDLLQAGVSLTNLTKGGDGMRPTPETSARIRANQTGRKLSDEWRANISLGLKGKTLGRKFSEEHKARLSAAKRGEKNPWFGKKRLRSFLLSRRKEKEPNVV